MGAAVEAAAISTRLAIFGHSDVTGDDEYNKLLSDRRSEVAFTLITDDFARFKQLCEDEAWTLEGQQAMLRAIGGNPGAIDGDPGPMTREAAARFVDNYNAGLFHRDATRGPEVVDLEPGQDLDGDRKIALIERLSCVPWGAR